MTATTAGRKSTLTDLTALAARVYLAGLGAWFAVWPLFGDGHAYLFALNSLALYLFAPLPLLAVCALACRKPDVVAGLVLAAGLWLYLWGALFWPNTAPVPEGAPVLRVMTYNALGWNTDAEAVLRSVRAADAGIVAFEELNPEVASLLTGQLAEEYPYQYLMPRRGVQGMGIISRYPMRLTGETIRDPEWVGEPLVVEVNFNGTPVTVVVFHAISHPANYRPRERQARKLADFARSKTGPLILAGDLNATSTNSAYGAVTDVLADAWREAGAGFGHTFPGASRETSPGASTPEILGIAAPKWLVRVDYVFYSRHWRAVSAQTGPFDGVSDHRPVVVELALVR